MNEVKWIKITTNIFDDEKIKLIDSMPDRDTLLVIWFKLLAMAGKTNDGGLVYVIKEIPTTDEMLATIFNRPINTVRLALKTFSEFGMIEINKHVNIVNWEKHQNVNGLDKIREQARVRQARYREKQKNLLEDKNNVTITSSNSIDIDIDIEKEIDKKTKKDKITEQLNELNISDDLKQKFIEFISYRKDIKKPLKTIRPITSEINKIGKDYQSEEHLIASIDWSMDKEYQGIFPVKNYNPNKDAKPSIDTKIVRRIENIEILLDSSNMIYAKDKDFLEDILTDDRYSKYRYILDKIKEANIV